MREPGTRAARALHRRERAARQARRDRAGAAVTISWLSIKVLAVDLGALAVLRGLELRCVEAWVRRWASWPKVGGAGSESPKQVLMVDQAGSPRPLLSRDVCGLGAHD